MRNEITSSKEERKNTLDARHHMMRRSRVHEQALFELATERLPDRGNSPHLRQMRPGEQCIRGQKSHRMSEKKQL
jgi:hypothetical protein